MSESSITNNKLRPIQEKHGKEIFTTVKSSLPFCGKRLREIARKFFEKDDMLATQYMSHVLGIDIYWKDYVYRTNGCDCWYRRKECQECEDCQEEEEIREDCEFGQEQNKRIDEEIKNLKEEEMPVLVREEIICSVCQRNLPDSELNEVSGLGSGGETRWFCKKCWKENQRTIWQK